MGDSDAAIAEFQNLVVMEPDKRDNVVYLKEVLFTFGRHQELLHTGKITVIF